MSDVIQCKILVTAREAASLLAISPRTLFNLTRAFAIPHVRIGRAIRYRVSDLAAFSEERLQREVKQ